MENLTIEKLKKMKIKCGMVDKAYCDEATMNALSKVPNKTTLLSMLCNVLQAPIRNLAVVCDQAAKKMEEAADNSKKNRKKTKKKDDTFDA